MVTTSEGAQVAAHVWLSVARTARRLRHEACAAEGRCGFFFSSRRRHTRCLSDWSSDVCSSDLGSARLRDPGGVLGLERFDLRGGSPALLDFALQGSLADLRQIDALEAQARISARDLDRKSVV